MSFELKRYHSKRSVIMAGSRIFICFLFWSLLSMLIVPCLGQTTAVILPHLQGDLTSEGGTGDPGTSNQTAATGDGANVIGSTSLLQIVGLLPANPGPPADFSGSDSIEPTATVSGGDDNDNITEDVLEAKVAEVLRLLTHQDARGQSEMEGQQYYGAYASKSELPRGKCLIAIIWEAAQPSASPDELLAFLDGIQDDLWDMEEDLMDLMEDVMYSDVFADDYYYEDPLDDDGSDALTDETNPDYYPDDFPEDSDFKEFSEGRQEDKNDHLLLFAPWMH